MASTEDAAGIPRLPLTSAHPLARRFEELKALFPSAVTDDRVDLEKLRALMDENAATGPERYGLSWAGRSDALRALRQLTTATLLPAPSESVNWDSTGHAIIEGDNLEVLKVMQRAYHGKVKLIYIDPPYNTGGDFIYPDDYAEGLASYQLFTRQINDEGHKLTTNVNTSGRYHSRWLTMIYPRLFLARNLLREDGVIFVSIDDHEVHNLRLAMDEIFGEENFIGIIVWKGATDNNPTRIAAEHEYLVCYGRVKECTAAVWKNRADIAKHVLLSEYRRLREVHGNDPSLIQGHLRSFVKANREALGGVTHYDRVDILIASQRISQALKNPQQFMEQAASAIRHAKREMMVDGIRYEPIDGQSYEMQLFENDEIESYLSRLLPVEHSIYDSVEYDSEVERTFASALDSNEDIRIFIKLPRWFLVHTPLGDYRPDWAIVRESDGKVYLVVETKGTTDLKSLPDSEAQRIKCGKRHFEDCLKVPYQLATTLKDLA